MSDSADFTVGIFNFNPYSIALYDAQGRFISGNESFRTLFGSIPADDYSLFSDPILQEQGVAEKLQNIREIGVLRVKPTWYNPRRLGPSYPDLTICVAATIFPVVSEAGDVEKIVVMHEDVTERFLAKQALLKSKDRYRDLFNRIPLGLYRSTPDGRILNANDTLLKMLKCPDMDTLLKFNARSAFQNPERRDQFSKLMVVKDVVRDFEFQLKCFDDSVIWVNDSCRAFKDENGAVIYYEGALEDVTDRKRAEDALQHSEKRYRTTIDAMDDMLHVVDRDLRVLLHNSNTGKWWKNNVPKGDWRSMNLKEVFPFLPDQVWKEYELVFRTGKTLNTEEKTLLDNEPVYTEIRKTPIVENNAVNRIITVVRNITERRNFEEQNRLLEDKLQQAQKMEAIGRLAGGIAHDFNNLLTGIKGYAELALKTLNEDDPLFSDVREIKKASDRASALTEQLLAFSRKRARTPKAIDINERIEQARGMISRIIGEDVHLKISLDADLGFVMIDPHQVDQILINLAANSRDAMPDGGTLAVETGETTLSEQFCLRNPHASPGDAVVLTVTDSGEGMDQETIDHIFEPFFTNKGVEKGTGLGLSTVYGIVRQNNGFIEVDSKIGGPTTFGIYFPRVVPEAKAKTVAQTQQPVSGEETVLIVEDEKMVRKLAVKILGAAGYKVLEAKDSQDALNISRGHRGAIDLLLTDVVMPKISGGELYRQLMETHPDLRVIYMSGYEKDIMSLYGIDGERGNYIQKPFTINELLVGVKKILSS